MFVGKTAWHDGCDGWGMQSITEWAEPSLVHSRATRWSKVLLRGTKWAVSLATVTLFASLLFAGGAGPSEVLGALWALPMFLFVGLLSLGLERLREIIEQRLVSSALHPDPEAGSVANP